MKILVVGAKGMLGTDLHKVLSPTKTVVGTDIEDFDITTQEETLKAVSIIRPDCLVNAAAFTQVDLCEKEEKKAMAVNGEGVKNLAFACLKKGVKMMLVSTDYIFDGRKGMPYSEEDSPNPLSVYGCSKLLGERYLQETMEAYFIIRTSWLYGAHGLRAGAGHRWSTQIARFNNSSAPRLWPDSGECLRKTLSAS